MATQNPRHPVFQGHPIAALAVICLSVFVISVDATIVNVALPTLSRDLTRGHRAIAVDRRRVHPRHGWPAAVGR